MCVLGSLRQNNQKQERNLRGSAIRIRHVMACHYTAEFVLARVRQYDLLTVAS